MITSVIIATYNQQKYIGRVIRSLLDQKLSDDQYEIIVVDDGSTDNTSKVLESFPPDPRLRIVTLEKNNGLPYAANVGIKMSLGRYVVRVDADDYVNEYFLSILTLFLEMNDDLDSVSCDYYKIDDNESVIGRYSSIDAPIACGILFRKENLIDIGLYDEDFLLHEDLDLRERYLKKFSIENVKLPLYRYRMHENNISKDSEMDKKYRKKLNNKHG